jgi:2-phospho-L-lactate guanylyltransferase (CobY/MobA/RfbA family)
MVVLENRSVDEFKRLVSTEGIPLLSAEERKKLALAIVDDMLTAVRGVPIELKVLLVSHALTPAILRLLRNLYIIMAA